jgi:hypothetical protein
MAVRFNTTALHIGEDLLPIGSVVRMEGVEPNIMIYGRKQSGVGGGDRVWDYVGCPYPQGHLSPDTNLFFDHEHIRELIFKGLETAGEIELRKELQRLTAEKN